MTARYPLVNISGSKYELPTTDTLVGDIAATKTRQYVKNSTGSTIVKGSAVYMSSATGDNVLISLAKANAEITSSRTLGLVEADITNGSMGYIITDGLLVGLDTSAATTDGDAVYLSPTVAGGLVYGFANKPSAPNHLVYLGIVSRKQQNNGSIFIKVQNGYELEELHNVAISSVANNDMVVYESATSLWKNKQLTSSQVTAALSVTALPVANGGTGTSAPSLVAGTNVTISGTWPNQTINSTGGGSGAATILQVLNHSLTVISVALANGFLPVLNHSGTTINVSVS